MKLSRFNSFIPYKDNILVFNSLNQKFLILKPMLHDLLMAAAREENLAKLQEVHPAYYNGLEESGIIISSDIDETQELIQLRNKIDFDDSNYTLIINPTMNCNFKCWYCYESHIKDSKMDSVTLGKIESHINHVLKSQVNLKNFHLSWFGGEPLLYFDKVIAPVSDYANELFKDTDVAFSMSFTTNGYLINEAFVNHLKKFRNISLQITLDGSREQHNKIRFVNKTKGSYDKIVENIIYLANNNISVQVRINYTPETLATIYGVLDDFNKINSTAKGFIAFSFHNVWQDGNHEVVNVEEIITNFRKAGFPTSSMFSDVNSFRNSCYADKKYQATINYNGEVHKCTARDFTSDRAEGLLTDDGTIEWNEKYQQRLDSKFKNSPCMSCRIQPICNGGCSQQAIEQAHRDYCIWEDQGVSKDEIVLSKFKQMIEMKVLKEEAAAAAKVKEAVTA